MAAQSHTRPLSPPTPPRTAFLTISSISSRLKHMIMQRKNTTAPESPKENHAKAPPSQTISRVSISASSSGSSGSSSSSGSAASSSGLMSPSPGFVSSSPGSSSGIVSSPSGSSSGFVASSTEIVSSSGSSSCSSCSSSGFVSASSSGSESPPRLKRLASSRRGISSLLERRMASASNAGKKRDLKGKGVEVEEEETGEVEYILFDGEGNPACRPGLKYKFMGNLK